MGPKTPIECQFRWPMQPDACSMGFSAGPTIMGQVCPASTVEWSCAGSGFIQGTRTSLTMEQHVMLFLARSGDDSVSVGRPHVCRRSGIKRFSDI